MRLRDVFCIGQLFACIYNISVFSRFNYCFYVAFLEHRNDPAVIYRLLDLTFHCMDITSPNGRQIFGAAVVAVDIYYSRLLHLYTTL